ncbi:hypothetical protein V8C35DRAFT_322202 [Trichoderma chlorosporum]
MAPRATLRKTIEKRRADKAASNNAKAALLQMPVELVREFSNAMPTVDKMVFAETCRAIHNSVGLTPFSEDQGEVLEEKFEYLARRSRETPNQWVCEECLCQHDIDESDTPANPVLACPVISLNRSRVNLSLRLIAREEYRLGRRHVQLALKYTRLYDEISPQHRRYLRRLMATHMYSFSSIEKDVPVFHASKITPRIINGRFLLKCIFELRQKSLPINKHLLAGEYVCQHQAYIDEDIEGDCPLTKFHMAAVTAFKRRGREFSGHCPRCCTDFSVKALTRSVKITVWHDLGTEGSAMDPVWNALVYSPEMTIYDECVVNDAPGRVRELYEDGE